MNRLQQHARADTIGAALSYIPPGIRRRVECDFFVGTDPVFAGLHRHIDTGDGRSYRNTAHVLYERIHAPRTTLVLPGHRPTWVIVHELGHVLHERIRFDHLAEPVSDYAKTNRWEAFAEAFTSWIWGSGYGTRPDPKTVALFESLR